jgi:hypothetical protein
MKGAAWEQRNRPNHLDSDQQDANFHEGSLQSRD